MLTQQAGAGHQLIIQQALSGSGNAGGQDHINNLHIGGEHGGLQAFQRHGLPGAGGTAHRDQTRHTVAVLNGADGFQEGGFVAQAAVSKGQVSGSGHQVVGGYRKNHRVLGEHYVHDLLFVVFGIQGAAYVFALRHGLGAGGTAGAVQDVEIPQVDHDHLSAGLLAGSEGFLQQNLTVAVFAAGGDTHYFDTHWSLFSFLSQTQDGKKTKICYTENSCTASLRLF